MLRHLDHRQRAAAMTGLWFWEWYACEGDVMGEDDMLTSDLC